MKPLRIFLASLTCMAVQCASIQVCPDYKTVNMTAPDLLLVRPAVFVLYPRGTDLVRSTGVDGAVRAFVLRSLASSIPPRHKLLQDTIAADSAADSLAAAILQLGRKLSRYDIGSVIVPPRLLAHMARYTARYCLVFGLSGKLTVGDGLPPWVAQGSLEVVQRGNEFLIWVTDYNAANMFMAVVDKEQKRVVYYAPSEREGSPIDTLFMGERITAMARKL